MLMSAAAHASIMSAALSSTKTAMGSAPLSLATAEIWAACKDRIQRGITKDTSDGQSVFMRQAVADIGPPSNGENNLFATNQIATESELSR